MSAVSYFIVPEGFNILHIAARQGDLEMVTSLILNGTDVNVITERKYTPLHWASYYGHLDVINFLIDNGADIDAVNDDNETALHLAVYFKQIDVVELLLKSGTNVNISNNDGDTPLHIAAQKRYDDIIKILISYDAKFNIKNKQDQTPFDLINMWGENEKSTISFDTDTSLGPVPFVTPFIDICKNGAPGTLEGLLSKSTIEQRQRFFLEKSSSGWTGLHEALSSRRLDNVRTLLSYGFDLNSTPRDRIFHMAAHISIEAIQFFLDHGVDIDIKDFYGETALYKLQNCNRENMIFLLQHGANIEIKNRDGDTPLHSALKSLDSNKVEILLDHGADINVRNNIDNTPLHIAVSGYDDRYDYNCIKMLLERKANVNPKNRYGWTPLHIATMEGYTPVVKLLLKYGADATILDNKQLLAKDHAAKYKYDEIVEILSN